MPIQDPRGRVTCDVCLNELGADDPMAYILPPDAYGLTPIGLDASRNGWVIVECARCYGRADVYRDELFRYYGVRADAEWMAWDDWREFAPSTWAEDRAAYVRATAERARELRERLAREEAEREAERQRMAEAERVREARRRTAILARPAYARGTLSRERVVDAPDTAFADGYAGDHVEDYRLDDVPDHHGPLLKVPRMWIPPLKNRDVRLISFEQEIMGDGNLIAERLHEEGLAENDYILGYHSRAGGLVKVEEDGSVDAEVIYQKVNLSDRAVARDFERGLQIVREAIHDGHARLSGYCGGHMHVDARGLEMSDLLGLYTTWNHAEDVLYRLAAANWPMHRSESGNDYAPTVRKNLGPDDFHRFMQGSRSALNMTPYLYARQSCTCGVAVNFGAWSECTCDLGNGKPTIEFRVWNATANLRKIRAYAAISIGMLEYARRNRIKPEDFPVNGWAGSNREPTYEGEPLSFILDELPMSRSERRDVRYCAERSTLAAIL